MYKNQSRITKYVKDGDFVVRRIMDEDGDKIHLVNEGWVNKSDCEPPLKVGDSIMINNAKVTVVSVAESEDGFSVKGYDTFDIENKSGDTVPFTYEDGTYLSYDYINDINPENGGDTASEIMAFLKSVQYAYEPSVIKDIAKNAFEAKTKLREKFKKSEFWHEDLQAVVIPNFTFNIIPDYKEVKKSVNTIMRKVKDKSEDMCSLYYACQEILPDRIYKNGVYLNDDIADRFERCAPGFKYHPGAKVTRFYRNVMDAIKVGEVYSDYEKTFAVLSDAASPAERKRTLVLSLNVLDFLTMSNGNSWTSCHNVEKRGCYHGGTLSYALDETTAILYTLDPDVDTTQRIWNIPKINRQLFMFGDDFVVESRLYPEPDEGVTVPQLALRAVHHKFIKEFYSKIMDKKFIEYSNPYSAIYERVRSSGLHYRDYEYERYRCGAMHSDSDDNSERITIGAFYPDIVTGRENRDHEVLTREARGISQYPLAYEDCESNYLINSDEDVVEYEGRIYAQCNCTWCDTEELYCPDDIAVEVDGYYYTPKYIADNFVMCDKCGEYERADDVIYVGDTCYCRECRDTYLVRCDHCGEWYEESDGVYVDGEYICENCVESETTTCSVCGERHFRDYFPEGSTVCEDCANHEMRESVSLPEHGVIYTKNIGEVKRVLAIAKKNGMRWKDGNELTDHETLDKLRRTFLCSHITGIGIRINEDKVSYAIEASSSDVNIPDKFGDIIKFENLINVESEV